ncbi:related to endo-beta-1,3-glucanase of the cell wall [Ramularia collo-cygni]|uniref:glucan endo-1,3-beta-D-glucosidase n=1 Tax=Ramularia collo-cygni TaxID=112498 RepID=A0A2D3VDW5_9PEZI|nr:related to endo-beta-1,3-glucanase of the cell wall [Ramularia collo-cygni]CZT23985.1 related to endo-beta-1,3-glucanase of the cell wall [Ramularia collo-cygni]
MMSMPSHDVHRQGSAQALRDIDNLYGSRLPEPPPPPPHLSNPAPPVHQHSYSSSSSLAPLTAHQAIGYSTPPRSPGHTSHSNSGYGPAASNTALAAGYQQHMSRGSHYGDAYDDFDPSNIADDGEDDFEHVPQNRNGRRALGAGAGAATGAGAGMLGTMGSGSSGGNYDPVGQTEKSEWLRKQSTRQKRLRWMIGALVLFLVVGGIVGGVVGGILANRGGGGGSSPSAPGSSSGGDLTINSAEIKALMNNKDFHKVFPAVDYTPFHAQYPACDIKNGGPDQNNVTIDIALLSQLAPAVRLYGTDCNQTELVLEAISRLEMQDTMKVWIGVYLDGNSTTNDRQIAHMWDLLDNYPHDSFAGLIVGNEVLYSKYMTASELGDTLEEIRKNATAKGINLPVATADLGDNWDTALAATSDIVMANIHPFFAGTVAEDSASWAYTFWQGKDVPLKTAETNTIGSVTYPTQIIAEIGWPTEGGNDCGVATDDAFGCKSDTDGAVASIDNLNIFLDEWVCGALNNGTTFFWFSAFDEPWKHQFDTAHNKWEPFWGLFDEDRNFKDGVKIPDCGGKTVDKPY